MGADKEGIKDYREGVRGALMEKKAKIPLFRIWDKKGKRWNNSRTILINKNGACYERTTGWGRNSCDYRRDLVVYMLRDVIDGKPYYTEYGGEDEAGSSERSADDVKSKLKNAQGIETLARTRALIYCRAEHDPSNPYVSDIEFHDDRVLVYIKMVTIGQIESEVSYELDITKLAMTEEQWLVYVDKMILKGGK